MPGAGRVAAAGDCAVFPGVAIRAHAQIPSRVAKALIFAHQREHTFHPSGVVVRVHAALGARRGAAHVPAVREKRFLALRAERVAIHVRLVAQTGRPVGGVRGEPQFGLPGLVAGRPVGKGLAGHRCVLFRVGQPGSADLGVVKTLALLAASLKVKIPRTSAHHRLRGSRKVGDYADPSAVAPNVVRGGGLVGGLSLVALQRALASIPALDARIAPFASEKGIAITDASITARSVARARLRVVAFARRPLPTLGAGAFWLHERSGRQRADAVPVAGHARVSVFVGRAFVLARISNVNLAGAIADGFVTAERTNTSFAARFFHPLDVHSRAGQRAVAFQVIPLLAHAVYVVVCFGAHSVPVARNIGAGISAARALAVGFPVRAGKIKFIAQTNVRGVFANTVPAARVQITPGNPKIHLFSVFVAAVFNNRGEIRVGDAS